MFVAALGLAFFLLSLTQPAWMGERIGPGLFARWLSGAIMAISAVWLVAALASRDADAARPSTRPSMKAGAGLLGGVAAFALVFSAVGLVGASALAALASAWGAGERGVGALAGSGAAGAAAAVAIGMSLLPPGTRLWPLGF
ncbi:MAG: tripartite tricarboxylate transporter TctB family protein [Pseudomonadota bacterium]